MSGKMTDPCRDCSETEGVAGLRLLTWAPHVSERGGVLVAQTSLFQMIVTLGAYRRSVTVDRRSRYVIIEQRSFWLWRIKRVIPFRAIRRIDYDYSAIATSLEGTHGGSASIADEVERFDVALIISTRDDVPETHAHLYEETVPLLSFYGDGQGNQPWRTLDLHGQQEELSRAYVERLRALTGASFGHELPPLHDASGQAWTCTGCGRTGPPRPGRCYYCGAELRAS